jgi:hypothetical protein
MINVSEVFIASIIRANHHHPEDGGGKHLRNGQFLPDYIVQPPSRDSSSNLLLQEFKISLSLLLIFL